jgi:hypothetical protein
MRSLATESVSARTGDAVGWLLNAMLGNLTELVIALAALHAGQLHAGEVLSLRWKPPVRYMTSSYKSDFRN